MGCYIIPVIATVIHSKLRKKNKHFQNQSHKWLNLLFMGGSIFGIIDHLWNKDLLSFTLADIFLGFIITASLIVVWKLLVLRDKLESRIHN